MPNSLKDWLKTLYVVFAFCSVLCFGALKSWFTIFLLVEFLCVLLALIVSWLSLLWWNVKEVSYLNAAGLLVGPIAGLILILGNLGVILGLFPAHVAWTVYTLLK